MGLRTYRDAAAIVTGAASGIGLALARRLAARGADVVLADLQGPRVEAAAAALRADGGRARAVTLDVADADAVEACVADVVTRRGRLDYLFNNAGIGVIGEILHHRPEHWRRSLAVNTGGVINGVAAAYPRMCAQGFGHIVNTASMAGLTVFPMGAAYVASKHAVIGLTRVLRMEAAPRGVRVSALCPGVVRTPLVETGGAYGAFAQPVPAALRRRYWAHMRPISADRFARSALAGVARNRGLIVVPAIWRVAWWLERAAPWLVDVLGGLGLRHVRRELDPLVPVDGLGGAPADPGKKVPCGQRTRPHTDLSEGTP